MIVSPLMGRSSSWEELSHAWILMQGDSRHTQGRHLEGWKRSVSFSSSDECDCMARLGAITAAPEGLGSGNGSREGALRLFSQHQEE